MNTRLVSTDLERIGLAQHVAHKRLTPQYEPGVAIVRQESPRERVLVREHSRQTGRYRPLLVMVIATVTTALAGCTVAPPVPGADREVSITPVVNPVARKAALGKLSPIERSRYCRSRARVAALSVEARISGPMRRQNSNAQMAGVAILDTVEGWYAGHPLAAEYLRNALAKGARIGAFTKILPYSPSEYPGYNPMNEPVYQVGNFIIAVAHGYAVLKAEYPDDLELLSSVKQWGDRLFEITRRGGDTFGGRSRGVDRRVLIAQGWAHWGNLSGNSAAIAAAHRYYLHAISSIRKDGNNRSWLIVHPDRMNYYMNLTYGPAVVTAHALRRSGIGDVYEASSFGGGTLVDGVTFLWDSLLEDQPAELMRVRAQGSRAVAWIELFVRDFPSHPTTKKMDAWLAQRSTPRYAYTNGGGPSTCLYRRIRS